MSNKSFKIEDLFAASPAPQLAASIDPPARKTLNDIFYAVAPALPLAADVLTTRHKWAPVYDMPDTEKGSDSYERNEARKLHYKNLSDHASRAQNIHNIWDALLTNGNYRAVRSWLAGNYHDLPSIDANFTPSDGGLNPLVALAQKDQNPNFFTAQALTAQALIDNGAELVVPDRRNLLPADYALMSGNSHLASIVVSATLEHYAKRYNGQQAEADYIPAISSYFASEADERRRMNAYANMIRNLRLVGDAIQDRLLDPENSLLPSMTTEAADFWLEPLRNHSHATFEQIAEPSPELSRIYQIAVEASERDNDISAYTPMEQKLLSLGLLTKEEKTIDRVDATTAIDAYLSAQRNAAMRVAALRRG